MTEIITSEYHNKILNEGETCVTFFLSNSFNFNLSFQSTINSELSELVPCGFSLEKFHCFYSARNLTILFISHTLIQGIKQMF